MKEFFCVIAIVVGMVLVVLGMLMGIAGAANHVGFSADIASIEQLRADSHRVTGASNEDVIGQVVEANRRIRCMQARNRIPVVCWGVPDGWDDIKVIEIREE